MEQLPSKLIFWNTVREHRADFLCLFPEQHIRYALRCLGLVFLNDVGIEILCGACTGVSQLSRHCDDVCPVCQKDRGYRVPECVRIYMGQSVTAEKSFSHAVILSGFILSPLSWVNT